MHVSDREKANAAAASLEFVESGMTVGLGTGSTAAHMLRLLGQRVRSGQLAIRGVPTSRSTAQLARQEKIELTDLDRHPHLDLTIDGADEVDGQLRLIKGGGGALLREKIVAAASARMIVIADSSKHVETLGRFPLPVEVVPFGWRSTARKLQVLGIETRLRTADDDSGGHAPFRTDQGNFILDCPFDAIADPESLAQRLSVTPGVVEHGLFVGLCSVALIGHADHVERLERPLDP